MITFRCKLSGNTVKFSNLDDINIMRQDKGYEEVMSFVVEEKVEPVQEKPKRGRKRKE